MAIAVASVSSNTNSGVFEQTSLTTTAPTGITTGDLLVIYAGCMEQAATQINTPTGFTQLQTQSYTSLAGIKVFYKYAVLADESATDYTVTYAGAFSTGIAMLRITGAVSTGTPSSDTSGEGASETTTTLSVTDTVTKYAPSLLIMGVSYRAFAQGSSAYTITDSGSNPTWTEVVDDSDSTGTEGAFAVAYANTSDTSNISAWGLTKTSTTTTQHAAILTVLPQQQSASATTTTLAVTPLFNTGTATSGSSGTSTTLEITPTINTGTATAKDQIWTNKSKTTAPGWVNKNKT